MAWLHNSMSLFMHAALQYDQHWLCVFSAFYYFSRGTNTQAEKNSAFWMGSMSSCRNACLFRCAQCNLLHQKHELITVLQWFHIYIDSHINYYPCITETKKIKNKKNETGSNVTSWIPGPKTVFTLHRSYQTKWPRVEEEISVKWITSLTSVRQYAYLVMWPLRESTHH